MTDLNKIIADLDPISLTEMDTVKLMNRTDTKFAFNTQLLANILEKSKSDYRILEIKNTRIRVPDYQKYGLFAKCYFSYKFNII